MIWLEKGFYYWSTAERFYLGKDNSGKVMANPFSICRGKSGNEWVYLLYSPEQQVIGRFTGESALGDAQEFCGIYATDNNYRPYGKKGK